MSPRGRNQKAQMNPKNSFLEGLVPVSSSGRGLVGLISDSEGQEGLRAPQNLELGGCGTGVTGGRASLSSPRLDIGHTCAMAFWPAWWVHTARPASLGMKIRTEAEGRHHPGDS